jgi:hypothetical protein
VVAWQTCLTSMRPIRRGLRFRLLIDRIKVIEEASGWYAVRCVFVRPTSERATLYEERVTLWRASTFKEAVRRAEDDAEEYVALIGDMTYSGLAQAFTLAEEPEDGAEVFSLVRSSRLGTDEYLSRFFDTGEERQSLL